MDGRGRNRAGCSRAARQRVAADMIEMEMRVDDEVDLGGIAVDRFQPCADLLTGLEVDTEQPGEPRAEPPSGVVLAIGVQPGVEQRAALGMFDQKNRDGHGDVALAAVHQPGEFAGYRAASEGVELDRHRRLPEARPVSFWRDPGKNTTMTTTAPYLGMIQASVEALGETP
jgi:hypothetical protein